MSLRVRGRQEPPFQALAMRDSSVSTTVFARSVVPEVKKQMFPLFNDVPLVSAPVSSSLMSGSEQ